jgi:hypothetical protein
MSAEIDPVEMEAVQSKDDRRSFLKNCGRFAVAVPPVVTMLLSTSLTSPAIAKSTGDAGNKPQRDTGTKPKLDTGIKRNGDTGNKLKQDTGQKKGG